MSRLKLISLLVLVTCFTGLKAQDKKEGIKFFKGTFHQAIDKAKKEKKILFVDFYTKWCGPCKRMEQTVFTQKKAGDFFNKKFICLQLNAEQPENMDVVKKYKVEAFPTLGFFNTDEKPISINVGGMSVEELVEAGKVAIGEAISFEQLYAKYKKNKTDLDIQQKLLAKAPQFLSAQEGMNAEKWIVRVRKLYRSYIQKKKGPALINSKDYIIISNFSGDSQSMKDEMVEFINTNLDAWEKAIGKAPYYFVVENNDAKIEALAKEGKSEYKDYLEKIKTDYKKAYSVTANKNITPYEKATKYFNALYSIYKNKNVTEYITLMSDYFKKMGENATPNDYGKAAQDLYYAAGNKLKANDHKQAIEWLKKALKSQKSIMDRINYLVMIGDSYREMKKYAEAEKFYNQGYAESLQLQKMEMVQQMIQGSIMQKRAKLELLQK